MARPREAPFYIQSQPLGSEFGQLGGKFHLKVVTSRCVDIESSPVG